MKTLDTINRLTDSQATERELSELLRDLQPDKVDSRMFRQIVGVLKDSADPVMLEHVRALHEFGALIDCSGTGGSGLPRFNTSTAVAFVLACAGLKVVKFGNRAVNGRSGSFDFLDVLRYPSTDSIRFASALMAETGLVFLFAPSIYPSFARLSSVRKGLGVSTALNFVGPLLNPVRVSYRLTGISDSRMQEVTAKFLAEDEDLLEALLVRSARGLDEIDSVGETFVISVAAGQVTACIVSASDLYQGSSADRVDSAPEKPFAFSYSVADNVAAFFRVLAGKTNDEAFRLVVLNAGAALKVANVVSSLVDGCLLAEELLISGRVLASYESCRRVYERISR
ncbi:MAG: hypothetical protein K2W95_22495 [Candidatus Obscuribacterales bacterium]|nr:hypothetical protein [Candidatus Obscuribacterales bacterium]